MSGALIFGRDTDVFGNSPGEHINFGSCSAYTSFNVTDYDGLGLSGCQFTGPLPALDLLLGLDLSGNNYELPVPQALVQACVASGGCIGVPPESCTAFGSSQLSALNVGECVLCPDDLVALAILFAVSTVGAIILFVIYIRLITKFPNFGGWIATSSIVLGQLHFISAISMLKSIDGSVTQSVFRFAGIAFFDITVSSPECLLGLLGQIDGNIISYAVPAIVVSVPVMYWLSLACHKSCVHYCLTGCRDRMSENEDAHQKGRCTNCIRNNALFRCLKHLWRRMCNCCPGGCCAGPCCIGGWWARRLPCFKCFGCCKQETKGGCPRILDCSCFSCGCCGGKPGCCGSGIEMTASSPGCCSPSRVDSLEDKFNTFFSNIFATICKLWMCTPHSN